ncbi:NAD(P)-dependent alcohol dehydrogenase [Sphingomonas bisphenolicum]
MNFQAALTTGPGKPFVLREVELEEPRDDEVLVRIAGVGICHTDIFFRDENMIAAPAILGHEGSGIVERVGSAVRKVRVGDRVVLTFHYCGTCNRCTEGDPAYCVSMPMLNYTGKRPDGSQAITLDGEPVGSHFFGQSSFATYALAHENNVVPLENGPPLEVAGALACGIQTGVGAIMRSMACEPGSDLLITGGGAVGLSAVMAAKIQGCRTIIVVEPVAARRALATEFGATHTIDPAAAPKLGRAVHSIVRGGVNYALDTTGRSDVQRAVMSALGSKSVFGLVGLAPGGTPPPGEINDIIARGITLRGIIEGDSDPDVFIPEMAALYNAGKLPFDKMVRKFPFTQINEAIEAQKKGECVKAILLMVDPIANGA